ncbi:MAG: glycosyltransferase family 39 protein [Verrucomicrobiota bacterium]
MSLSSTDRRGPTIGHAALLFLACLLLHGAGTWSVPLIDRDEPRFAEASREMRERGDYVVPYFNNQYRFDKPPLIYWAQVASYYCLGENDFAARFPSMVAAALTAVLLFAWGRRLGNARVGWWAAIIFSLCLQIFLHGKAALPDMWLVFFVTAAHWAAYELIADSLGQGSRPTRAGYRKYWQLAFYLALAFAFLAKGPIGWIPLLTVASTKLFLRDQPLNPQFRFATGMLGTLAVVLAWGIPALLRTNGEFFRVGIGHHIFERAVGTSFERQEANSALIYFVTLPFYFLAVFVSFFPWSIKLPALIRQLWRRRDGIDNYLIAGIVPIFLILTFVNTKFFHYTLPAFPLLSLLLARHLFALPGSPRFAPRAAVAALTVFLCTALFLFPFFARVVPSVQLFKKSRGDLRPEMEFANVGYRQPSVVWYFRSHVHGWFRTLDPASVHMFMDSPGARFVILPTRTAHELYPTLPQTWKSFSAQGFLPPRGKRLDFTLILKP